eukprot:COSAG06_NODE_47616_length_338_cov_0.644351_1_plen_60_part_10
MWIVTDGSAAAEACEEGRAGRARVASSCPFITAYAAAQRRAVLVSGGTARSRPTLTLQCA